MIDYQALHAEVLRVHLRYATEIVEGFDFCPWARGARSGGKMRTEVHFGSEQAPDSLLLAIEALEHAPADIVLLVFPELTLSRVEFQHFAARVREAASLGKRGRPSAFAIADFHPDVTPDLHSPERLVAFIRKSPDPLLQLIRHSALQAVRLGERQGTRFVDPTELTQVEPGAPCGPDPLHTRIARANLNTVKRTGIKQLADVLADIERDRDQSYQRLGLPPPPWSRANRP